MVRTPLHKEKSSAKYGSAMKALLFSQITDQEVGQRTRASQESHHTIIVCSRNVAAVSLPALRSGFSAEADASGCMRVCQIYFSVACGENQRATFFSRLRREIQQICSKSFKSFPFFDLFDLKRFVRFLPHRGIPFLQSPAARNPTNLFKIFQIFSFF